MKTVIIAYNEARMLPMMLGHLPRGTDVTVIDGAYEDFPHDKPWSTDGTIEIAQRWGAKVVKARRAWKDQCEKRNKTLIPGEVVFVPDADEMLHTDMPVLPPGVDVGWVTILSPIYERPYVVPRVFRCREGWHFAGRHHWVYDADGDLVSSHLRRGEKYTHAVLPVMLSNARDMRESVRDDDKKHYIKRRNVQEMSYADESCVYTGGA